MVVSFVLLVPKRRRIDHARPPCVLRAHGCLSRNVDRTTVAYATALSNLLTRQQGTVHHNPCLVPRRRGRGWWCCWPHRRLLCRTAARLQGAAQHCLCASSTRRPQVLVLEKNAEAGRKILISGGTRWYDHTLEHCAPITTTHKQQRASLCGGYRARLLYRKQSLGTARGL